MRLQRLDLTRYGKFTDHSLDFGPRVAGQPDLHIVYGPNEAGKSTTLSAILDLLYGIEMRSRYDFLHPYATMRIGAVLETQGGMHSITRIKRTQRSLLGPGDQPISEGVILADLRALDRAAYQAMFSLDDDTLEQGGESILASKGDLGQLLFSATAGLAEMSHILDQIRIRTDEIHKPYARTSELAKLRDELAALKDKRERVDTLAPKYAALVEARDSWARQYDAALDASGKTKARIDRLQRLLNALPRLAALQDLRTRIAPLAGLPEVPEGWAADLPGLQRQEIEGAAGLQAARAAIGRIEAERAGIVPDEAALAEEAAFSGFDRQRTRHRAAGLDLEDRRRELRDTEVKLGAALARLDQPADIDPARLILKPALIAALHGLIARRSGIDAALAAARREHQEAIRQHAILGETLAEAEGARDASTNDAMAALRADLPLLRAQDHARRQEAARDALAQRTDILAAACATLLPWTGGLPDLSAIMPPPPGAIEGWAARLAKAEADIALRDAEIERLDAEQTRLRVQIDTTARIAGLVSDGEAAAMRGRREALWAEHRRRLDTETAERFEAGLRQDDGVMAARLSHQGDLARLHGAETALAETAAQFGRASIKRAETLIRQAAIQTEIDAAASGPALPRPATPAGLAAWFDRRAATLDAARAVTTAEAEGLCAHAAADAARDRLRAAMLAAALPVPPGAPWETLLGLAQAAIERDAKEQDVHAALRDRQRDIGRREAALREAMQDETDWNHAWASACAACWIGASGRLPTPGEAAELLRQLEDLGPLVQKKTGLADRIADMEADRSSFAEAVHTLAARLEITVVDTDTADQAIATRLAAARTARDHLARLATALNTSRQDEAGLLARIDVINRRKAVMTAHFAVDTLIETSARIAAAERRALWEKDAHDAEQEILIALDLPGIAAAEAALAGISRADIEAELAILRGRLDGEEARSRDAHTAHEIAAQQIEAVGGDDEVARIEVARRTVVLEIEDKARHYIRLRAGILAAEMALRAYRDTHRSAMMARASDAFRLITREAYRGLSTQPDKEEDVLVAIGADGGSKLASDLSKGTRFQLYLALRAAGYHEFARQQPAVPFIADDIMETFDDFRAEETFRLLGAMASAGQVIYLTHHRHLCDIAQRTVEGVRLHTLPG